MEEKLLLLGDQAVALGAIHAGITGVYAYPGTPSTEITEYIQTSELATLRGVHSRWCTNEKTAMEAALGVSYVGKRALVCMKHVGLNVAADAFVNSAVTGTNGGLVVLLRQIRIHADAGTFVAARSLRHDVLCVRSFRTAQTACTDAYYHADGAFAGRH